MTMPSPARATAEVALTILYILVMAWAPFPYGSNRPWASTVLAVMLGALLMAWAGAVVIGRARLTPLTQMLWLPGVFFAAAVAWALIQTVDLGGLDRVFGGHGFTSLFAHPIWMMASHALGEGGAFVSVDPARSLSAIVATLMAVASFLVAFELGREPDQARLIAGAVVVVGCAYAALAFAQSYLGLDTHSWLMADAKPVDDRLSGPFINPNHFATFAGMAAIAAIALFLEVMLRSVVWDRGGYVLTRTFLQAVSGLNAIWLACGLLLISSVLLTQSRGGIAAFLVGLVVLLVCISKRTGEGAPRGALRWMLPSLLLVVVGVAVWIAAAPMFERAQRQGVEDESRAAIAQATLKAIAAAPLVGNGFGAFERYYPLYADGSVVGDVDEAHNDYLETLADLGLPAGLAFIATPAMLAFLCVRGAMTRRRDRMFPAVGAAASALVGAHALVDFSLQIPAVSLLFTMLLGVGVAQAWSTVQRAD